MSLPLQLSFHRPTPKHGILALRSPRQTATRTCPRLALAMASGVVPFWVVARHLSTPPSSLISMFPLCLANPGHQHLSKKTSTPCSIQGSFPSRRYPLRPALAVLMALPTPILSLTRPSSRIVCSSGRRWRARPVRPTPRTTRLSPPLRRPSPRRQATGHPPPSASRAPKLAVTISLRRSTRLPLSRWKTRRRLILYRLLLLPRQFHKQLSANYLAHSGTRSLPNPRFHFTRRHLLVRPSMWTRSARF